VKSKSSELFGSISLRGLVPKLTTRPQLIRNNFEIRPLPEKLKPKVRQGLISQLGLLGIIPSLAIDSPTPPRQVFHEQLKKWFPGAAIVPTPTFKPFPEILSSQYMLSHAHPNGAPPDFRPGPDRAFRFEGGYTLWGPLMQRLESFSPASMAKWMSQSEIKTQTQWIQIKDQQYLQIYYKGFLLSYSFVLEPVRIEYQGEPWTGRGRARLIFHYRRLEDSSSLERKRGKKFQVPTDYLWSGDL
jgi:hypothetical protein